MTYSLSLSDTPSALLTDVLSDARLSKYTLAWQDEAVHELLLCIPGASTRGVNLKWRQGETQVRLHTLASPADWKLALNAVQVLAQRAAQDIRLDQEGQRLSASELERRADPEWIARRCHLGTTLCLDMVLNEQQIVCLQGWSEPYHIGSAVLAKLEIGPDTDSETAYMALVKSMRAQQVLPGNEEIHRPIWLFMGGRKAQADSAPAGKRDNGKCWEAGRQSVSALPGGV